MKASDIHNVEKLQRKELQIKDKTPSNYHYFLKLQAVFSF